VAMVANYKVPVVAKVNRKTLIINLQKKILPTREEEKSFTISISNLFMQCVRKHFKKRLIELNISVMPKISLENDKNPAS
jgi:hypothetical protein